MLNKRIHVALFLTVALALAACGSDAPSDGSSPGAAGGATPGAGEAETQDEGEEDGGAEMETATVRLAALPLANYTIFKAAEEQGYLEEEGIELDITYVPQGAVALEALIGGSVDVAFPAHLEFIQASTQHDNLRILMGFTRLPDEGPDNTAFLVREGSGIESPEDLGGKRLAAGLLNSINHFYTQIWLEQHGVDPATVSFVEVPFPNMQDALDNEQVDGVFNVEPFVTVMTDKGGYLNIGHPYMEVNPGFTIIPPTVRQEWLDENPEVAERLVRAFEKGAQYLREAEESERIRLVSEFTEIDSGLVEQMQLPIYETTVRVDTIQKTADLALERGMIDTEVDVASLLAPTATVE